MMAIKWRPGDNIERLDRERVDRFLEELTRLGEAHGFAVAERGISLTERPGSNELPEIDVTFMQWPRNEDR